MTQMTQEEIVTNTKTVLQGLEALRHEHMSIMSNLTEGKKDPDKVDIIQKNLENIELGLGEAQVSETLKIILRSAFVIDLEASPILS
jgi:kinesin light chain